MESSLHANQVPSPVPCPSASPFCPLGKFKHLNLVSNPDLVFTYIFSWYLVTVARPDSFQFPKFILLLASLCITFSKFDWLKQGCAAQCLPVACLGWERERDLICSFLKKNFIIIIFSSIFISWRLITLQYCSGFCHTLTWISHGFTCIPHPDPPSHLPLYPIQF